MRVSLAWIERLLGVSRLPLGDDELRERLTLGLTEIEALERLGPSIDPKVVVGTVLTCVPHPNADRLRCTTVDVGRGSPLPVVCGAPNVATGQSVAVALPGAQVQVPAKDGSGMTSITIKAGKLRGEPSEGMICAEDELGLSDQHHGILVLSTDARPGTPLVQVLPAGDRVLIINNICINNRPDLWGHLGWAREIAAICDLPGPQEPDLGWTLPAALMTVEIADSRCGAYRGAVMTGVANGPSPAWMQSLLTAVGVRPLGLLIDVTNFVMLELGEPMHAFDRRRIAGDRLLVRSARPGETLTTLDGKAHDLHAEDLLIADADKALALAGIMGGEASGVASDTTSIVLEAATFHPTAIRRSRIRAGMATDSSSRFEKGLYPELCAAAINRAIALLTACCPGCQVLGGFGQSVPQPLLRLPFEPAALAAATGLDLPRERQQRFLERLGFAVTDGTVNVPWWRRKDVSLPVDLIEEIARQHGWKQVKPEVPRLAAAAPAVNRLRQAEHSCRSLLAAQGWDEVATYCFTSEAWATTLQWPQQTCIRLAHPLSQEQTVLRASLLPNLAMALARNQRHLGHILIYEVGKIYGVGAGAGETGQERVQVAGLVHGPNEPFYAARDAAAAVLAGLGHAPALAVASRAVDAQDGRAGSWLIDKNLVASVAQLPPAIAKQAGISGSVAWFCIELERLVLGQPRPAPHAFREPSRFQASERDFTFLCPEALPFAELATCCRQAGKGLVREVALAQDVFRGAGVPAGHKAVSLRVILQADDRSLTEAELVGTTAAIIKGVESRTAARLRV